MSDISLENKEKSILYICGAGHSGSTLLDILLGAQNNTFSAGELVNLPQKGIINKEFCSCGKPVPNCEIWSRVIDEWEQKRKLSLEEYVAIQNSFNSIKKNILSLKIFRNLLEKEKIYLEDTYHLYDTIFNVTNANIIVDSSKSPNKILMLKKLGFNVTIVHLTRRFGDVLNSNKKTAKKNVKAGIEHDIKPRKTLYILLNWVIINFLIMIFSKEMMYKRIKYEDLVQKPEEYLSILTDYELEIDRKLKNRGPFYPKHLVAGNKIRMLDEIYISEKPMNTSYHRLNTMNKILAICVDNFY